MQHFNYKLEEVRSCLAQLATGGVGQPRGAFDRSLCGIPLRRLWKVFGMVALVFLYDDHHKKQVQHFNYKLIGFL